MAWKTPQLWKMQGMTFPYKAANKLLLHILHTQMSMVKLSFSNFDLEYFFAGLMNWSANSTLLQPFVTLFHGTMHRRTSSLFH